MVDSWATVTIPTADADADSDAVAPRATSGVRPTGRGASAAVSAPARVALADEAPPVEVDEADAPPPDEEPAFDPGPEPVIDAVPVAEATPNFAAAAAAAEGGIQRYGEAVVREVLGATFLEEVEAPPRAGFGERG